MVSMKLEGLKELQDQLMELKGAVAAAKSVRRAARKALEPVLEKMKSTVPVDSGLLRDSLKISVQKGSGGDTVFVLGIKVAVGKGGGRSGHKKLSKVFLTGRHRRKAQDEVKRRSAHWRWHFVELGTSKKAARPFIRPAFDGAANQMIEEIKTLLAGDIAKVLKRNARRRRSST